MIDWPVVLIVLIAVVVLGGLLWLAAWWYLPSDTLDGEQVIDEDCADGLHEYCLTSYCDCPCHGEDIPEPEDEWPDQLHEINQLGKFGDLTRPVAHLTHYEVEALIRTLAVPEWVPDRWRMAA